MKHFHALFAIAALAAACAQPTPEAAIGAATSNAAIEAATSLYPSRVYWGDTHVHTSTSADALATGTRLGPEVALRFARGEKVRSVTNEEVQLDRPLDFMVIADHSE